MNRLSQQKSLYLRQHADNPVHWQPWGAAAFAAAKERDVPLLVSIGYSSCHWCHVMEHESFSDPAVAAYMNAHFVCIKVDREERPDVDELYMAACQMMTGAGGWPLNSFCLPDRRPFFAGTYYPPESIGQRVSWMALLERVTQTWQQRRPSLEQQAGQLTQAIAQSDQQWLALDAPDKGAALSTKAIADQLMQQADLERGGFGGAPKFPSTMSLRYLLDYAVGHGDVAAHSHVIHSLLQQLRGGLYDQLGGGFARYTVDADWQVPHFEKMLYDNGLIVALLADAYRVAPSPEFAEAISKTLAFVRKEMQHPDGVFYAALDADSEGEEGRYYTWTDKEVTTALGPDSELFKAYYGISIDGNWEGTNILHRRSSPEAFAEARLLDPATWRDQLDRYHEVLLTQRAQRPRPHLDTKIVLSWNALMIIGFTKAFHALGDAIYKRTAVQALTWIDQHLRQTDGSYWRIWHDAPQQDALLEDYALLIHAYLEAYTLDWDTTRLHQAAQLAEYVHQTFADPQKLLYYAASEQADDLVLRQRPLHDGALPSGNAVMAHNWHRLSVYMDEASYRRRSMDMLEALRPSVQRYPLSFSMWAGLLQQVEQAPAEVAIVGPAYEAAAKTLLQTYWPGIIFMAAATADTDYPLLRSRASATDYTIYICQAYACGRPLTEIEAARAQLQDIYAGYPI